MVLYERLGLVPPRAIVLFGRPGRARPVSRRAPPRGWAGRSSSCSLRGWRASPRPTSNSPGAPRSWPSSASCSSKARNLSPRATSCTPSARPGAPSPRNSSPNSSRTSPNTPGCKRPWWRSTHPGRQNQERPATTVPGRRRCRALDAGRYMWLSTFPQARLSTVSRELTCDFARIIHKFMHRRLSWQVRRLQVSASQGRKP